MKSASFPFALFSSLRASPIFIFRKLPTYLPNIVAFFTECPSSGTYSIWKLSCTGNNLPLTILFLLLNCFLVSFPPSQLLKQWGWKLLTPNSFDKLTVSWHAQNHLLHGWITLARVASSCNRSAALDSAGEIKGMMTSPRREFKFMCNTTVPFWR